MLLCCAGLAAGQREIVKEFHVAVPMRDGVRLYANLFLPGEHVRVPALLERTPYGKSQTLNANYQAFVEHGYAVVLEDVRGRYESEGIFDPLHQEVADGDDTLNWIARQPWSDGKIGMVGGSYRGIVQWKAALSGNPHLKAIFPVVSGDDDYRDRFYSTGGAMKLGNRLEWMAENLKAPGFVPDFARFVLHLPVGTADVAATGWTSRDVPQGRRASQLRCLLAGRLDARPVAARCGCRCSRWAAGTTISPKATWMPTPRCARPAD